MEKYGWEVSLENEAAMVTFKYFENYKDKVRHSDQAAGGLFYAAPIPASIVVWIAGIGNKVESHDNGITVTGGLGQSGFRGKNCGVRLHTSRAKNGNSQIRMWCFW